MADARSARRNPNLVIGSDKTQRGAVGSGVGVGVMVGVGEGGRLVGVAVGAAVSVGTVVTDGTGVAVGGTAKTTSAHNPGAEAAAPGRRGRLMDLNRS